MWLAVMSLNNFDPDETIRILAGRPILVVTMSDVSSLIFLLTHCCGIYTKNVTTAMAGDWYRYRIRKPEPICYRPLSNLTSVECKRDALEYDLDICQSCLSSIYTDTLDSIICYLQMVVWICHLNEVQELAK
uniref:Uncharacterized protein n=1 Tax=Tanacetum cinerariifolium TaxID=118510 RepID=A0A699IC38_TANCI|nr:hypothetical protein [Tanacetum cinerariifolium]